MMKAWIPAVAAAIIGTLGASGASAQVRAPRPGEVETAPIQCWWKTDKTAIRVGERFTLVLTCGVIETTSIQVVPAVNQLEPGAVSLTPFEAVAGIRREDVVVPPRRYIQYEYTMRLLSEGFFGQDLGIPALTITYNLQSPGGSIEGRDQTYVMPPLPMRVLSLVPRAAVDIRDASDQTFATVESRRFQSTLALIGSGIAFALAAVFAGVAAARTAGRFRTRDVKAVRPLPAATLLGGSLRTLSQVRTDARGGWTPELRSRALAALRVAAAAAMGRDVAQEYVEPDVDERAGQIDVRSGLIRRKRALVSAATTPVAIATRLESRKASSADARAQLQEIGETIRLFASATYGRNAAADDVELTNALDRAVAAVKKLRVRSLWAKRIV